MMMMITCCRTAIDYPAIGFTVTCPDCRSTLEVDNSAWSAALDSTN